MLDFWIPAYAGMKKKVFAGMSLFVLSGSFPRKWESRVLLVVHWIPAYAGMSWCCCFGVALMLCCYWIPAYAGMKKKSSQE